MSPFSVVILLYVLAQLNRMRVDRDARVFAWIYLVALTAFTGLQIDLGYFIKAGGNSFITFSDAMNLMIAPISVCKIFKSKYVACGARAWRHFLAFTFCATVSMLLLIVLPETRSITCSTSGILLTTEGAALYPAQINIMSFYEYGLVLTAALNMLAVFLSFDADAWKIFLRETASLTKLMLIIGAVEIVVKYGFHSNAYNEMLNATFGLSSSTFSILTMRSFGFILQGLTKEASHYVYSLSIAILVLFVEGRVLQKKNNLWILLALVAMALSTSMSAFLYVVLISLYLAMYWLKGKRVAWTKKHCLYLGGTAALMIVALIVLGALSGKSDNPLLRRLAVLITNLDEVVNGRLIAGDGSSSVRLYSVVVTLRMLLYRPLFGVGPYVNFCHGSTANLLGEYGLLGTLAMLFFQFFSYRDLRRGHYGGTYAAAVVLWFFTMAVTSRAMLIITGLENLIIFACLTMLFTGMQDEYKARPETAIDAKRLRILKYFGRRRVEK